MSGRKKRRRSKEAELRMIIRLPQNLYRMFNPRKRSRMDAVQEALSELYEKMYGEE